MAVVSPTMTESGWTTSRRGGAPGDTSELIKGASPLIISADLLLL